MEEHTEVYFTQKQLVKLLKKLRKKSFTRIGLCDWSQTWENPETNEKVVLIRG